MSNYSRRKFKYKKGKQATIPIKNKKEMNAVMTYFLRKVETSKNPKKEFGAYRNYMMCLLGFNTAFRAEDLLQLKVSDVINGYVSITEFKRKKKQIYRLNKQLYDEIKEYVEKYKMTKNDYLFPSYEVGYPYPITRQRADDILNEVKEKINLKQPFSMHSLRKTFAYQKYIETRDIFLVMRLLGHSEPNTTLLYICWETNDAEIEREKTYYSPYKKE